MSDSSSGKTIMGTLKITKLLFLTLALSSFLVLTSKAAPFPEKTYSTSKQEEFPLLDRLLADFFEKSDLPGLSIAVNKGGTLVYTKGLGYADVEQKQAMLPSTSIRTASVTKVITATALGKLASDGKLDLDLPIGNYLFYLKTPLADLTARQIAGHTAGIPHRPAKNKDKFKHYTEVRSMVSILEGMPLEFTPNTQYQYSSLAYNLLAALIEEVSGKSYVDYMQEEVFKPLGMVQTYPDDASTLLEGEAKMYYFKKDRLALDKKKVDGSYKLAGAGFRSTALDLVKMMDAYSNGFIKPAVVNQLFASNQLADGTTTNVGIGWRLNTDPAGNPTIEHAGSWQGARTVIVYYPEQQLSVSIMVNAKCVLFIEETAHLIAQFFLDNQKESRALKGIQKNLSVSNIKSDNSTTTYTGTLHFSDDTQGVLDLKTDIIFLQKNNIYHLAGKQHFALATEFGLIYVRLDPTLKGGLYLYQLKSDKHHMNQDPMLYFDTIE